MSESAAVVIRPHKGPQERFLASSADIAIYGGAAGGGKSWALLLEALRNTGNAQFGATIFRRTRPQITNNGGLWDESAKLYPLAGGTPLVGPLEWRFPSGSRVSFKPLQHRKDVYEWQGSQVAMIGFDELAHFEEFQFWYMTSRNRSTSGVKPYLRATTNPVPKDDPTGGWVHRLIQWWINPDTGYAIPERSGVVRWFVRVDGTLIWADSEEELREQYPDDKPQSLTFITAKLDDNPTLNRVDPSYRAKLRAMPTVERMQLLDANWNVRRSAGLFFRNAGALEIVPVEPAGLRLCRAWDLAATEGGGDWTAGVKIGVDDIGVFYVVDVERGQWAPDGVRKRILQCAVTDGRACKIRLPQDPGQAGKDQGQQLARMLAGYAVKVERMSGPKEARASGFAAQVNAGNVKLVEGPWNKSYVDELDAFGAETTIAPDDQVDASSDAFQELTMKRKFAVG